MPPARYLIEGRTLAADDPGLQPALGAVHGTLERPRCLCVIGGVEMYVARHLKFIVKRMPDSGHLHHPTCPSFEPAPGSSGLADLIHEAVVEHAPDRIELHTDFALARGLGRAPPRGALQIDPPEVHASRKRMSLRALMHFLYERAGLNRWFPAMEGKRNQSVLHKYLSEAARGVWLKGATLHERLYVPEPFRAERREEIAERRRRKLAMLQMPDQDQRFAMAVVLGEFKDCEATGLAHRLMLRHLPDVPLHLDTKTWQRVVRQYGAILQARDADVLVRPRVMVAALIYARREGVYQIDTLSMMLVTDQWVPLEGLYELPLIERLQREQRAFIKPLRYDARSAAAFANVLLLDCEDAPLPLHVIGPFADARDRALKERAVRDVGRSWIWRCGDAMPELPLAIRIGQS